MVDILSEWETLHTIIFAVCILSNLDLSGYFMQNGIYNNYID